MLNRKLLAVVLLMAVIPAISSAADRYVRPGATGNGSGSDWANAYTSLPQTLNRGDTYYIADGTYPRRTLSTPAGGTTLITIKKATPANHGTDTGWNDSFGDGQAVFGQLRFTTPYWVIDGATGGRCEEQLGRPLRFQNDRNGYADHTGR